MSRDSQSKLLSDFPKTARSLEKRHKNIGKLFSSCSNYLLANGHPTGFQKPRARWALPNRTPAADRQAPLPVALLGVLLSRGSVRSNWILRAPMWLVQSPKIRCGSQPLVLYKARCCPCARDRVFRASEPLMRESWQTTEILEEASKGIIA